MTRHTMHAVLSFGALTLCLTSGGARADDAKPSVPAAKIAVKADAANKPAAPAEPTLKVGDPAPKLSITKWVKGEPVPAFEDGKVYVVEFWATWCGPCKTSIPHVTKLQEQYKDKGLRVIGVDIWERDVSLVEPFVKEMGDKMGYTVGIEEPIALAEGAKAAAMPRGRMATDWMAAAGQNGIPCSFIVDQKGTVAWIGHPMTMDKPLGKVLAGTFDAKAEAELKGKVEALNKDAIKATQAKEYDKVLQLRDEIVKLDPEQADSQRFMKMVVLMAKGDADAANGLAGELLAAAEKDKDGMLAARTASVLLSAPGKEKADKAVALKAAKFAYEASDKSAIYGRLLAQAHAASGEFDKAAELQAKVVADVKGPMKERDEKTLEEYKEKVGKRVD